jgi:hypothetical protein
MRRIAAGIVIIAAGVIAALGWIALNAPRADTNGSSNADAPVVALTMRSDPYPLVAGRATLYFTLTDSAGMPITGARIAVDATMNHAGMLPTATRARETAAGTYAADLILSMMDGWTLNVTATDAAGAPLIHETYPVYVYPVQMIDAAPAPYISESQVAAWVNADATRERWIVIPQGTQAMMRMGGGDDLIPAEIRLALDGQDTLVIRNDDFADHVVGPFFVRAGETVRQTFTRPAEFRGVCTIRHGEEVALIVQ